MEPMTTCLPVPKSYRFDTEPLQLEAGATICLEPDGKHPQTMQLATQALGRYLGLPVQVRDPKPGDYPIRVQIVSATPGESSDTIAVDLTDTRSQSYRISLTKHGGVVRAASGAAAIYACAALGQLIKEKPNSTIEITTGEVSDQPRFAWRGFSMDIARNFYGLTELTTLLDLMASYRMNVLHLHLSDDQGWRLELDCYPGLAQISGVTSMAGGRSGYLTKSDYAQLQELAAARGIVVIPEIDIPGHVNAIQHALGELTPQGEPLASYGGSKVGFSKLYPQLPATWKFLQEVFSELAAQTTGPYIHVGGDEAMESTPEEYQKIVQFAVKTVHDAGKLSVGWQEAAKADLDSNTIIQYWNMNENTAYVAQAAQRGAKLIMSPANRIYLDMKETRAQHIGVDWAGVTPLEQSYDWDPATAIGGIAEENVQGVEAALWTEKVAHWQTASLLLLPRLLAAAEVAWSPQESRDFARFSTALPAQYDWWARLNLPHTPQPPIRQPGN